MAALVGVPAIAVSGLLADEVPGAKEAAAEWVVKFAASDIVRELEPMDYITVSFPPTTPHGVLGVRVTGRAPHLRMIPRLARADGGTWEVVAMDSTHLPVPADSDQAAWHEGYIAVVPMRAAEVDEPAVQRWRRAIDRLPEWTYAPPEG